MVIGIFHRQTESASVSAVRFYRCCRWSAGIPCGPFSGVRPVLAAQPLCDGAERLWPDNAVFKTLFHTEVALLVLEQGR